MRYLLILSVLLLAGCQSATAPEADFARKRFPPGIIPCDSLTCWPKP